MHAFDEASVDSEKNLPATHEGLIETEIVMRQTRPNSLNPDQDALSRDIRDRIEQLSGQAPRDPEAQRGFILTKIETIKNTAELSDSERNAMVDALQRLLDTR